MNEIVEARLDCSYTRGRGVLRRHLPGRQAKVERYRYAAALSRAFCNDAVQMHELGTKHLQPLGEFLGLLLDFPLGLRIFRGFVAEMDIHARLTRGPAQSTVHGRNMPARQNLCAADFTPAR